MLQNPSGISYEGVDKLQLVQTAPPYGKSGTEDSGTTRSCFQYQRDETVHIKSILRAKKKRDIKAEVFKQYWVKQNFSSGPFGSDVIETRDSSIH